MTNEERQAYMKDYLDKNREKIRESQRRYRQKHREEINASMRAWRHNNPEHFQSYINLTAKRTEIISALTTGNITPKPYAELKSSVRIAGIMPYASWFKRGRNTVYQTKFAITGRRGRK